MRNLGIGLAAAVGILGVCWVTITLEDSGCLWALILVALVVQQIPREGTPSGK